MYQSSSLGLDRCFIRVEVSLLFPNFPSFNPSSIIRNRQCFWEKWKYIEDHRIKTSFTPVSFLYFHSCVFYRLPMRLIQKGWNEERNFPGFCWLVVVSWVFFQLVLTPSIATIQKKITDYLQGNAEFLPLNFPFSVWNAYWCSPSIFRGSRVPYHLVFIWCINYVGQKMSDFLCEKHTNVYDFLCLT